MTYSGALISDGLPNIFHRFAKHVCLASFSCYLDTVNIATVIYFIFIILVVLIQNAKRWNSCFKTLNASIQIRAVSAFDGGVARLWTACRYSIYDMCLGTLSSMHQRGRGGSGWHGLLLHRVRLKGSHERPISLREEGRDSIWSCISI